MMYSIIVRDESGAPLAARVLFKDAAGGILGEATLPDPAGTILYDSDIPPDTVSYRFEAAGYNWYGTSQLYDTNVITLVKKVNTAIYVLAGAIGLYALSRLLKL